MSSVREELIQSELIDDKGIDEVNAFIKELSKLNYLNAGDVLQMVDDRGAEFRASYLLVLGTRISHDSPDLLPAEKAITNII